MSVDSSSATATANDDEKSVYILQLEDGKLYVGATGQLDSRFEDHRSGHGAKWTQEHPVKRVLKVIHDVTNWKEVEKELTIRMMKIHGWENVRGGPWTQRDLDSPPRRLRG